MAGLALTGCHDGGADGDADVQADCTLHATSYCNEGDRGGLQDAAWSQCQP